jgi:predicted secreted protein
MNRKIILLIALALLFSPLWAQDTAVFVDLGFSPDGRTYSFGQHGINADNLRPWAEFCVIDVASNNFVPGGRINYVHDSPVVAGNDGSGALFRIISRNAALADRYNIGYLLQGYPLYVSLENGVIYGNETIEFRNFETGESYRATLTASGYNTPSGSSFTISLEKRNIDGTARNYTIGNAGIKRPGIVSYRIRKVLVAPRTGSLIFVIEMKRQNASGSTDIRYMVETLRL